MKIGTLRCDCGNNGKSIVELRVDCHSVADCEQIIAWLELAKTMMTEWEKISEPRSFPSPSAASKHEDPQPGKIQGEPQK